MLYEHINPFELLLCRIAITFYQAFKSYDESGSVKKITCLKYLVLANMLMKSSVDPFEAQEVCVLSLIHI